MLSPACSFCYTSPLTLNWDLISFLCFLYSFFNFTLSVTSSFCVFFSNTSYWSCEISLGFGISLGNTNEPLLSTFMLSSDIIINAMHVCSICEHNSQSRKIVPACKYIKHFLLLWIGHIWDLEFQCQSGVASAPEKQQLPHKWHIGKRELSIQSLLVKLQRKHKPLAKTPTHTHSLGRLRSSLLFCTQLWSQTGPGVRAGRQTHTHAAHVFRTHYKW